MDGLTDLDRARRAEIEAALRTYPSAPAPDGFTRTVMSRLHKLAPKPRFRLSWLDYAASLFVAGMLGLLFLLWNLTPPLLLFCRKVQLCVAHLDSVRSHFASHLSYECVRSGHYGLQAYSYE